MDTIVEYVVPVFVALFAAIKSYLAAKDAWRKKKIPKEGQVKLVKTPGELDNQLYVYKSGVWTKFKDIPNE